MTPASLAAGPAIRVRELPLPAPEFESFTFERYRPLLRAGMDPDNQAGRIAVGAWFGEEPLGLAPFSRLRPSGERALLSVMVSPFFRRRKVASRLLAIGEEVARARGATALVAVHSTQLPAIEAYEGLLRAGGWDPPIAFEQRAGGPASWALDAARDWAPFLSRLRGRGFRMCAWTEATPSAREQIQVMVEKLADDEREFDPFNDRWMAETEPRLSVLLRRNDENVGWIRASRVEGSDAIFYTHGYVVPEVRRAGWLLGGLQEVCQMQCRILGPESTNIFHTSATNEGMRRFMNRQLRDYWLWSDVRYRATRRV